MLLDMLLHRPDLTFDFCLLHKDPTLVERREEAMAAARMKMQEELDAKASIFREKQKLVEFVKNKSKKDDFLSISDVNTLFLFNLWTARRGEEEAENRDVGEYAAGKEL